MVRINKETKKKINGREGLDKKGRINKCLLLFILLILFGSFVNH